MTMTVMKSDLLRWLKLFIRDIELRPLGLTHDGEVWWLESPIKDGPIYTGETAEPRPIGDEHAELLIIAKAIRWFNTKHEGLTIGDGHFDEEYSGDYFTGFSVQVFSPGIDEIRSGDRLIDALYETVVAVLDNTDREWKEHYRHFSWWNRLYRWWDGYEKRITKFLNHHMIREAGGCPARSREEIEAVVHQVKETREDEIGMS